MSGFETTKMIVSIELLSNMCCSNGEGNGVDIDMETCSDEIGLPIIPGKRLKGLLKECCELLVDNNYKHTTQQNMHRLFGGYEISSYKRTDAILHVGNATIDNYNEIKNELISLSKQKDSILTKQRIRDVYCELRSSTSIDDNGVAKKQSLRTIQTVKKGIVFYSQLTLENATEKDVDLLQDCVKMLRHIGLNKSRGLGEVQCKVELVQVSPNMLEDTEYVPSEIVKSYPYTITLLDDIVMSAGSNLSPKCITGSMLMGAFAKYANHYAWFEEVILKRTIFSNAYLSEGENVFWPTPFSLYKIKNNDSKVYNVADGYCFDEENQYVPIGGFSTSTDAGFINKSVKNGFEYHYNTKEELIFSYNKITQGQVFRGTITTDENAMKKLKMVLRQNDDLLSFGGSKSAQYSKCRFEIQEPQERKKIEPRGKMIIELLSNAIIFDEFGQNSCNVKSLVANFFNNVMKFSMQGSNQPIVYSKISTVGGFNSAWKLPKRQYTAFSAGTVIEIMDCHGDLIESVGYIGLFQNEGFGQYRIRYVNNEISELKVLNNQEMKPKRVEVKYSDTIFSEIKMNDKIDKYKMSAIVEANKYNTSQTTLSQVMHLWSAYRKFQKSIDVINEVEGYIEKSLKKSAYELFERIKQSYRGFSEECKDEEGNDNVLFRNYFKEYLLQIKRNYQKQRAEVK